MTAKKIKSPGRPRAFDTDHALETAIRLFQARGYDAVGVAELVGALGIKPPSFYSAFGSKAGLLAKAIERYSAGEANVFERAREAGGSIVDVLDRTLANAARLYPLQQGLAGCLVLDGTRNSADPEARGHTDAAKRANFEAIRDFVATDYPQQASDVARLMGIALAGMSAAARDGAEEPELTLFAQAISRSVRERLA